MPAAASRRANRTATRPLPIRPLAPVLGSSTAGAARPIRPGAAAGSQRMPTRLFRGPNRTRLSRAPPSSRRIAASAEAPMPTLRHGGGWQRALPHPLRQRRESGARHHGKVGVAQEIAEPFERALLHERHQHPEAGRGSRRQAEARAPSPGPAAHPPQEARNRDPIDTRPLPGRSGAGGSRPLPASRHSPPRQRPPRRHRRKRPAGAAAATRAPSRSVPAAPAPTPRPATALPRPQQGRRQGGSRRAPPPGHRPGRAATRPHRGWKRSTLRGGRVPRRPPSRRCRGSRSATPAGRRRPGCPPASASPARCRSRRSRRAGRARHRARPPPCRPEDGTSRSSRPRGPPAPCSAVRGPRRGRGCRRRSWSRRRRPHGAGQSVSRTEAGQDAASRPCWRNSASATRSRPKPAQPVCATSPFASLMPCVSAKWWTW